MDFGARSSGTSLDLQGLIFRFYDHWLKGEENGVVDEKPVRIYVMGENAWRMEDEWPLSRATEVKYYLHSAGRASTLNGDGVLGIEPPGVEPIDDYVYNPIDPVPTRGGQAGRAGLHHTAAGRFRGGHGAADGDAVRVELCPGHGLHR